MTTPKLTPWFPATVKPVHVGVYKTKDSLGDRTWTVYRYWNGKFWGVFGNDPKDALFSKDTEALLTVLSWRGLAEKPG